MIDPKEIRENFNKVKADLEARKYPLEYLENYQKLDTEWRQKKQAVDLLKEDRNKLTPKGKPTPEQLQELKQKSEQIKKEQETLQSLDQAVQTAALLLPNIIDSTTPIGASEDDNIEIRKWGDPKQFSFNPLPHEQLAEKLDIIDFKNAAKVTGSRFSIYKGMGAKLERALINFMLDTQTDENGYTEVMPPAIVNRASMYGTGQLPKFEEDAFKLEQTEYFLSPTAEVQLTNMYRDMIIPESELPVKLAAYTPCFRREAGSYGKDVTGIIRQHQFNKVELVKFVKPEASNKELDLLLQNAETILQKLKLPYRVIQLCSGDLGFSSSKTYDIEVWFPSQNRYREISSCSNFLDFQARRAMIRYRQEKTGKVYYLHTLNGSGLAVGRTLAAVVENYQTQDGCINIPGELEPYIKENQIK